jgi:hypothetical protein
MTYFGKCFSTERHIVLVAEYRDTWFKLKGLFVNFYGNKFKILKKIVYIQIMKNKNTEDLYNDDDKAMKKSLLTS